MTTTTERGLLISVAEACRLIGGDLSPRVLYQWASSGKLPAGIIFRPSRRVFVVRAKLLDWLGQAGPQSVGDLGRS